MDVQARTSQSSSTILAPHATGRSGQRRRHPDPAAPHPAALPKPPMSPAYSPGRRRKARSAPPSIWPATAAAPVIFKSTGGAGGGLAGQFAPGRWRGCRGAPMPRNGSSKPQPRLEEGQHPAAGAVDQRDDLRRRKDAAGLGARSAVLRPARAIRAGNPRPPYPYRRRHAGRGRPPPGRPQPVRDQLGHAGIVRHHQPVETGAAQPALDQRGALACIGSLFTALNATMTLAARTPGGKGRQMTANPPARLTLS